MDFKKAYSPAWTHYFDKDKEYVFKEDQCGSWQYNFNASKNQLNRVKKLCEEAVLNGVAVEVKFTNEDAMFLKGKGKCCFYCNGDDMDAHKKILAFFIDNNMVMKDNFGNIRNMAFCYDSTAQKRPKGSVPVQMGDFFNLKTATLK